MKSVENSKKMTKNYWKKGIEKIIYKNEEKIEKSGENWHNIENLG